MDRLCSKALVLSIVSKYRKYDLHSRAYVVFYTSFLQKSILQKSSCSFFGSHSSPQKRQGLNVFPTLNCCCNLLLVYHISLLLCQVQPHNPPASGASLTHQSDRTMPTIEFSMGVFNWQLESINAVASSHGYSTINYIRTYSWMKIHFQLDSRWKHGQTLSLSPYSCPEKAIQSCRSLGADSLYSRLFHPWSMSGIYLEKL